MESDKKLDDLLLMKELSTAMRLTAERLAKTEDMEEEHKLLTVLNELSGTLYNFVHYSKNH